MSARLALPALLALLAIAGGCTGDVDPLAEAIEVRELGLASLAIVPPPRTFPTPVINAGESLSFTLVGGGGGGGAGDDEIEVSETGRRWSVSDASVASIDANGRLVALADGPVTVGVRIGDIAADGLSVRVATAELASIDAIVGPEVLDPCTAGTYYATGTFDDDARSMRLLRDATWTIGTSGVERRALGDGAIDLSASVPGMIDLTATVGQRSFPAEPREIVVNGSLEALAIGSSTSADTAATAQLRAAVGSTVELSAIGTYSDAAVLPGERDVTSSVDWEVVSGTEFVSVSNDPATRGRVTANGVGVASIRARCGTAAVSDARSFRVFATSTTDSSTGSQLSFEDADNAGGSGDGGVLSVPLGAGVQLRVSTGSTYDEDDDVTQRAEWSLVNADDIPAGTVSATGFFTPSVPGSVQVRAEYLGNFATLTITVTVN